MAEYFTDTEKLMRMIKLALREYSKETESKRLSLIKSWNLGFVFPESVYPALSVFPISKTFLPVRSAGLQSVEYRFSIDVYSAKRLNVNDAKAFCFDIIDESKKAIKKSIRMIDTTGVAQSFATTVEQQAIFEPTSLKQGLFSTASLIIVINAFYQMNIDRVYESTILEADYDTFFDKVVDFVKGEAKNIDAGVKKWAVKTPKLLTQTPGVFILPGNEFVREERSNGYALLVRPITFHVLSRGYPKLEVIRRNIKVADKLVTAIEKNYMVGGYAQECELQSIIYGSPQQDGFNFSSTINVEYTSRVKLSTKYS